MKEHAKKALKHDTKVLGKTVPTMIIIGLFLVGGGSAALLSTFGTVSGDAVVDQQAISMDDEDNQVSFEYSKSVVPPETYSERVTLTNNNADTPISFNWMSSVSSPADPADEIEGTIEKPHESTQISDSTIDMDETHGDIDWKVDPQADSVEFTAEFQDEPSDVGMEFELNGDSRKEFQVIFDRGDLSEIDNAAPYAYQRNDGERVRLDRIRGVSAEYEREDSKTDPVTATVTIDRALINANTIGFGFKGRFNYNDGGTVTYNSEDGTEGHLDFGLSNEFSYGDVSTYREFRVGEGVSTGVYEVTSYDLYDVDRSDNSWSQGDLTDEDVVVEPSADSVTVTVENGGEAIDYTNLEISHPDGYNYQVMYDGSGSFDVKNASKGNELESKAIEGSATDFETVVDTSENSNNISITVEKFDGLTFAVHQDYDVEDESIAGSVVTKKNIDGNGAIYDDTSTEHHQNPSVSNLIGGSTETLEGDEEQEYNVVSSFSMATEPADDYTVDVTASVPQ